MKQLKTKFIILTMTALLVLLVFIVAGMNLLNYHSVVREADTMLVILAENGGRFPGTEDFATGVPPSMRPEAWKDGPDDSRYFSYGYSADGNVVLHISRYAPVDVQTVAWMGEEALQSGRLRGFLGDYRYVVRRESGTVLVTFLDCGRKLDAFRDFCTISILMSLMGFAVVFFVVFILAGRIIRPIAESYEKQKRFITDAGHEIKTPLTIINANADLLEMELGENESLTDIKAQTRRLRGLTEDLVMLSRMEEAEHSVPKVDFPISEVVEEATQDFKMLAQAENKELLCRIQPGLSCKGDSKAIRQLVSILLDNAMKYSPGGTAICLELAKQGRSLQLAVSNIAEGAVEPEQLKYVFDRFYRTDQSRSSETGGHGIGLSVAKAIVTSHGGKIHARTENGKEFTVTAVLPV